MSQRDIHIACGADNLVILLAHDDKRQAMAFALGSQRAVDIALHVILRLHGFGLQLP